MEAQEHRLPTLFIIPLIQFFVGLLLFIALLHGQRDLTMLAFLVLGMVIAARLWSRLSLSGIKSYSTVDAQKVFPGETLTLKMSAENAKLLPVWLQMKVPVDGALHPSSRETTFAKESGLLWYQRAQFQWELTAQRRGVHEIGPTQVKVADLFGFFPREKEAQGSLHIIVYPRLVPLKPISLPRRDLFGVPGAKSPVQDPIYILGTRDYQHWRPARHIHWKASARHNRLQEKVFEPSEQEKVLLVVEVNRFEENDAAEAFERTIEVVASLAAQFDQKGYAVGFATNGVVEGGPAILPIGRSPQQVPSILEALARLKMKAMADLANTLNRGLQLAWGASCVHFSYERGEGYFSNRNTPVVFVVCRPRSSSEEDEPRLRGRVYRLDEIRLEEKR
jgi:uncharacterized protein (DUF58 family)